LNYRAPKGTVNRNRREQPPETAEIPRFRDRGAEDSAPTSEGAGDPVEL
jgi:hypothetical protein